MPKVYQAYYKKSDILIRYASTSRVTILAEAKKIAKELGKKVVIDVLEIEKPSMKYFVECMNGRKPNSRKRLCSFVPKGSPVLKTINNETIKLWRVQKKNK
jgi:hypothetical protein